MPVSRSWVPVSVGRAARTSAGASTTCPLQLGRSIHTQRGPGYIPAGAVATDADYTNTRHSKPRPRRWPSRRSPCRLPVDPRRDRKRVVQGETSGRLEIGGYPEATSKQRYYCAPKTVNTLTSVDVCPPSTHQLITRIVLFIAFMFLHRIFL